jgi:hypothetical protein
MRTLTDNAAAMLHDAALDHRFWSLAVKHVCWVRNRVTHRSLKRGKNKFLSPHEKLYDRPGKIAMLRVFGCDCWRFDFDRSKDRITNPKAKKGIFVGISPNRKGWMIFDPKTRSIRTSYHCSFNEDFSHRRESLTGLQLKVSKSSLSKSKMKELRSLAELYAVDPATSKFLRLTDPDFGSKGPKIQAHKPSKTTLSAKLDVEVGAGGGKDNSNHRLNRDKESDVEDSEVEDEDSSGDEEATLRRSKRIQPSTSNGPVLDAAQPTSTLRFGKRSLATTRDFDDNDTLVRDLIPVRTEEPGVFVELTAEDLKFLKFAFDHD